MVFALGISLCIKRFLKKILISIENHRENNLSKIIQRIVILDRPKNEAI